MRFSVLSFDFDHTLTLGATAAEHLAVFLDAETAIADAEAAFRAGRMTTAEFTDATANLLSDRDIEAVCQHMLTIPLVAGIAAMVKRLRRRGLRVVINTVAYRDILLPIAQQLGFDEVSGVWLERRSDRFTGQVTRYFRLEDKIRFAEEQAQLVGVGLDQVIAVGDGLSDAPLFAAVGRSVAFNADARTNALASAVASGETCDDLERKIDRLLFQETCI